MLVHQRAERPRAQLDQRHRLHDAVNVARDVRVRLRHQRALVERRDQLLDRPVSLGSFVALPERFRVLSEQIRDQRQFLVHRPVLAFVGRSHDLGGRLDVGEHGADRDVLHPFANRDIRRAADLLGLLRDLVDQGHQARGDVFVGQFGRHIFDRPAASLDRKALPRGQPHLGGVLAPGQLVDQERREVRIHAGIERQPPRRGHRRGGIAEHAEQAGAIEARPGHIRIFHVHTLAVAVLVLRLPIPADGKDLLGILVHGHEIRQRQAFALELLRRELIEIQFALDLPERIGLVFRPILAERHALDGRDLLVHLIRLRRRRRQRDIPIDALHLIALHHRLTHGDLVGDALAGLEVLGRIRNDQMLGRHRLGGRAPLQWVGVNLLEAGPAEIAAPQQHMRRLRTELGRDRGQEVVHVALQRFAEVVVLLGRIVGVIGDLAWPFCRQQFGLRVCPALDHRLQQQRVDDHGLPVDRRRTIAGARVLDRETQQFHTGRARRQPFRPGFVVGIYRLVQFHGDRQQPAVADLVSDIGIELGRIFRITAGRLRGAELDDHATVRLVDRQITARQRLDVLLTVINDDDDIFVLREVSQFPGPLSAGTAAIPRNQPRLQTSPPACARAMRSHRARR